MQRTFVNTREFRRSSLHFQKHGRYTLAPIDSSDWYEFWKEEERRCLEGMTVGGLKITGKHYWYMNYMPIQATDEDLSKLNAKGDTYAKMQSITTGAFKAKGTNFPRFWAVDWDWWTCKQIAMFGATYKEVEDYNIPGLVVQDYTTLHHQSAVKTRRAGFSYKEAADGMWNYNFIRNSKSYYFAALEEYLIKDGILNKVKDMMDHLNKNTDGWWRRNRHVNNSPLHRKASYYNAEGDEKGYLSEIIGVPIDNPNKVRGKDGVKITYEEGGSFKNLKKSIDISIASLNENIHATGQMSVFGTGGEEGESIEGLTEVHENPKIYKMLPFYNIYEKGMEEEEVGMFIPCFATYEAFMDEDGNLDMEKAVEYDDTERALAAASPDPKKLDRRKAEFPRSPSEALQRVSVNDFPIAEIDEQILTIRKTADIRNNLQYGNFINLGDDKKPHTWDIRFAPLSDNDPPYISKFPHRKSKGKDNNDDLEGCSLIIEPPERDEDGNVKPIYDVIVDPYAIEEAEDTTSLYVSAVIKYDTPENKTAGGRVVAIYAGRPQLLPTAHRTSVYQAVYYGCKIQSEIAGGGETLKQFIKALELEELLHYEPLTINNKEIVIEQKNRTVFMSMPPDRKRNGLTALISWLKQPIGIREDGKVLKRLNYIYDIPTLQEMRSFHPKKNFDRISVYILIMFMLREFEEITYPKEVEQQRTRSNNDFWERGRFTDNSSGGTIGYGSYGSSDNSGKTSRL